MCEQSSIKNIYENNTLSRTTKPSAYNLSLVNWLIHHIIIFNILPRGGHRDNVSYLDIYLLIIILSGEEINLSYIIIKMNG